MTWQHHLPPLLTTEMGDHLVKHGVNVKGIAFEVEDCDATLCRDRTWAGVEQKQGPQPALCLPEGPPIGQG